MHALLVVNPKATTASPRTRDVLARALASEVSLTVEHTKGRGHATELAAKATQDGVGIVVAFGGDGTVNEVVNGVLEAGADQPLIGVVPGGSTNVFSRAVGLPRNPVDATGMLLDALDANRSRTVSLGRLNDRWFTFCAGFGIDAEVIHRVERARRRGKTSTGPLYLRLAVAQFFNSKARSGAHISISANEGTLMEPDNARDKKIAMAIVQNTAPWTYLGSQEIHACPDASFDTGLELFGMQSLPLGYSALTGFRMLSGGAMSGGSVVRLHDAAGFELSADMPLAAQVDGEYIGEATRLRFSSRLKAIRVAV
ncbi:MAG: diacylglycerol kinase family lipid kinase [Corynebacteriales bacterium]|nr:diacylglycerol kinase family lipid kinase [Mycobacteriales bacterium]